MSVGTVGLGQSEEPLAVILRWPMPVRGRSGTA